MMAPVVHRLEAQYEDRITFTFLDIDDSANEQVKRDLGFRVQPEFNLLDADGNVLEKWFGYVDPKDFEAAIKEALAK